MLDVAYEAVTDLPPGRLADIDEDRGRIRVRLDKHEKLADVLQQLNIAADRLLRSAHWFQLWKDEIVSRDTPDCPLRVEYVFHPKLPQDPGVLVWEDRGIVRVHVCRHLDTERFAALMNHASEEFLAGGQWFQLYGGEIIDNSPEPMSRI
jgi:hypothetical protein